MQEIKTLGLANDKTARELLERTAWQVQPIMRKHRWSVRLISGCLELRKCSALAGNIGLQYTLIFVKTAT